MKEMLQDWKRQPAVGKWQYLCLLMVAGIEFAYMSPRGQQYTVIWVGVDYLLEVPAMAFLMLSIARGIRRKGQGMLHICLAMLLWIGLVQSMREVRCLAEINRGEIICFYALALPMAFCFDDGQRQWGLKTMAVVYVLEALRLCLLAGALYFDVLPELFRASVRWDGARLLQMFHPTNCAALLLIGIGISLGWCLRSKKRWLQVLLVLFVLLQFVVLSLTNGRTGTVFTCLLVGGILFCALRKTDWKRAPLALAVGVAVMAVLFVTSQKLFAAHQQRMTQPVPQTQQLQEEAPPEEMPIQEEAAPQEAAAPQEEAPAPVEQFNMQNTFLHDMLTLNSRTTIWTEAVRGLLRNPKILVCGTDDVAGVLAEEGSSFAMHTHNPYLEITYMLGIPGLLLALLISILAIRGAVILLWKNANLWKSAIALTVMCLMGCGMLEPYLFVSKNNQNYLTMFFLMGVGYLHHWTMEKE